MKYLVFIFLSLFLFHPLLAQQEKKIATPSQPQNSLPLDSLIRKLHTEPKQVSPFPNINSYQRRLSDWRNRASDSAYAEQKKLERRVGAAIFAIPKNTPNKPHQMEGFYRLVSTENEKYTRLLEAAVTIQDTDYKTEHNSDNLKVQLKQLRQTNELGKVDSVIIKETKAFSKNAPKVVSSNYLYRLNQINLLRGYNRPKVIFNAEGWMVSDHLFKLTDTLITGNDTIYTIAFEGKSDPRYSSGYLKINTSDFAIVEYERSHYVFGDFMDKILVRNRKIENRYYPEFIKYEAPRLINDNLGEHQLDIHTFWLDMPVIAKFKEINKKNQLNYEQEVHTFRLPYNSAFWSDYKMLKLHPLEVKIKSSLEIVSSLENQFREEAAK